MNYSKIYDSLIERAKNRVKNENTYYETHHILPRCLGGGDNLENLVRLTSEEHFLAHKLLVCIYPEHKGLKYALFMMTIGPNGKRNSNKWYGWFKRDYLANRPKSRGMAGRTISEETKQKMREKRKLQVFSEETKKKISNSKKGVKMSEDAKKSMNEKRSANSSWMNRKTIHTEETKRKISEANRGLKHSQKECPHCHKKGAGPNMTRYHFDNCKKNLKVPVIAL